MGKNGSIAIIGSWSGLHYPAAVRDFLWFKPPALHFICRYPTVS
jgi:hypothetical protein